MPLNKIIDCSEKNGNGSFKEFSGSKRECPEIK